MDKVRFVNVLFYSCISTFALDATYFIISIIYSQSYFFLRQRVINLENYADTTCSMALGLRKELLPVIVPKWSVRSLSYNKIGRRFLKVCAFDGVL